jgi:hypothetical protein
MPVPPVLITQSTSGSAIQVAQLRLDQLALVAQDGPGGEPVPEASIRAASVSPERSVDRSRESLTVSTAIWTGMKRRDSSIGMSPSWRGRAARATSPSHPPRC